MADKKEKATDPAALWKKWERELHAADEHEKDWKERAKKIVKRYRDERDASTQNVSQFNILYSNTEVLRGAVYQRTPVPEVRRRFSDKDPVGKAGSEVLDRALTYALDAYDFDGMVKSVVEDALLPGRGVARVKYSAQTADVQGVEQVVYEEARCEYVDWEFFRYSPAKRWDKVRWVAFGDLLTRDDLTSQFGKAGELVKLDWAPDGHKPEENNDTVKRALVWQIWDKTARKVYVWASGYNAGMLAVVDDPLRLEQFFPCPRPVYSICTTNSLIPVPEYTQYQDQAAELDELTARITALTDALRFRGVYDGAQAELGELSRAGDGEFKPVENYAALVEKGGLEKSFSVLPIKDIAVVVQGLVEQREILKQTIYEVTGISDIFRGASEAEETATAQQIKAQYGGIRIKGRQQETQRFVRDLLRLKAEIMAEHFSPQTLAQISGVQLPSAQDKQMAEQAIAQAQQAGQPPDPQAAEVMSLPSWEEVTQVISNDKLRGYKIDIETDSTIQPDQKMEQESRIEAISAFGGLLQQVVPAIQLGIMPPDMAAKLGSWVIRSFKNPGELEESLDKMASQPPQPQGPTPEQIAELEKREQEVQKATQKVQEDGMALEGERVKLDADKHSFTSMVKAELEKISAHTEAALERIAGATDALKSREKGAQDAHRARQAAQPKKKAA